MLDELIRDIYETANMDMATAEKVGRTMVAFLERKLPPDDFVRVQRYLQEDRVYTPPPTRGFPGYGGNQAPE
jgi:hypothetical protein